MKRFTDQAINAESQKVENREANYKEIPRISEGMEKRCTAPLTIFGSSGKGAYNCILPLTERD